MKSVVEVVVQKKAPGLHLRYNHYYVIIIMVFGSCEFECAEADYNKASESETVFLLQFVGQE